MSVSREQIIAPGKALCCGRTGIKGPGDVVTSKDFGSVEALQKWKDKGYVIDKPAPKKAPSKK